MIAARAAEFDRASRQPKAPSGDAKAKRAAAFREQIAKGDTDGMRIAIDKAVHVGELDPDAANELVAELRDRTSVPEAVAS
jgi:DNA-directed RNA polymerase subunit F